jgi:hypothetical protein
MTTTRSDRIESAVQIIILLIIGGIAGAASFTHVHDWTIRNAPAGTGSWFGWANAIISELTPTAAGLEIRRRRRHRRPVAYPMTVLVAAAALSLAAQVAQARPSATGWLLSAVPALAFLALTKLVLSRTNAPTAGPQPQDAPAMAGQTAPILTNSAGAVTPVPESPGDVPGEMLLSARMAAFAHQQATGQPITTGELASHLAIAPTLAATLLHALDGTATSGPEPSPVTTLNGTRPDGNRP